MAESLVFAPAKMCPNISHDPRKYHDCALEWEWNYIKNKLNIDEFDVDDVLIYREDRFWYVEK